MEFVKMLLENKKEKAINTTIRFDEFRQALMLAMPAILFFAFPMKPSDDSMYCLSLSKSSNEIEQCCGTSSELNQTFCGAHGGVNGGKGKAAKLLKALETECVARAFDSLLPYVGFVMITSVLCGFFHRYWIHALEDRRLFLIKGFQQLRGLPWCDLCIKRKLSLTSSGSFHEVCTVCGERGGNEEPESMDRVRLNCAEIRATYSANVFLNIVFSIVHGLFTVLCLLWKVPIRTTFPCSPIEPGADTFRNPSECITPENVWCFSPDAVTQSLSFVAIVFLDMIVGYIYYVNRNYTDDIPYHLYRALSENN